VYGVIGKNLTQIESDELQMTSAEGNHVILWVIVNREDNCQPQSVQKIAQEMLLKGEGRSKQSVQDDFGSFYPTFEHKSNRGRITGLAWAVYELVVGRNTSRIRNDYTGLAGLEPSRNRLGVSEPTWN
jgi:hypothetical protein